MSTKQKAIFLDRDGVINQEVNYLHKIEDFKFTDNCISALKILQSAGYKLFIVTNQAGIGRGYYSESDFHNLMNWVNAELVKHGVHITDIEFCPHHPTEANGIYKRNCSCRKPKPGMLLNLIGKHNVDVSKSFMVGDKFSDLEAAEAADIKQCILVKSGHAFQAENTPLRWKIFDNIYSFAQKLNQDFLA